MRVMPLGLPSSCSAISFICSGCVAAASSRHSTSNSAQERSVAALRLSSRSAWMTRLACCRLTHAVTRSLVAPFTHRQRYAQSVDHASFYEV